MMNTTNTVFAHQMLTGKGWQTVAELVAEMQADGMKQALIDRWLQGIEAGIRARAAFDGRSISTLSPLAQRLAARHERRIRRAA